MAKRKFLVPVAIALSALFPTFEVAAKVPVSAPMTDAKTTLITDSDKRMIHELSFERDGDLFSFVIERGQGGEIFAAHRSHRSHRSHSSHRSHYSSR